MTVCRISKEIEFDAGHRVPSHGSKCRNPHGHRYRVQVTCEGRIVDEPGSPDDGMLVDFSDLKRIMVEHVHDPLDHSFICAPGDPLDKALRFLDDAWQVVSFPYIPTAENIARWCWEQVAPLVETSFRDQLRVVEIAVWETPTSVAYYRGS